MRLPKKFIVLLLLLVSTYCHAQTSPVRKWSIKELITYALQHNITIRQTALQTEFSVLEFQQQKKAQLPTFNFSTSAGYSLGRSDNPTTGVLENNNFFNMGMQLQSGVTIFNWFAKKNTTAASHLNLLADKEQLEKIKTDVTLNVFVAYLQILLATEQVKLAQVQINQVSHHLDQTKRKVAVGVMPELNAAELTAQLARDSAALITSEAAVQQLVLQLKTLLAMDASKDVEIETVSVDAIPVEALHSLQPENIYAMASKTMPAQKVNSLKVDASKKMVAAARGLMYPSIALFGGMGTNYVNIKLPQYATGAPTATGAKVNVAGTDYIVTAPSFVWAGEKAIPIGTQFSNNFGQNIGISIAVPIFNGGSSKTAWQRSKLNMQQRELEKEETNMQLKQSIYKAYIDATAALAKVSADKKLVQASEKANEFASIRYALNLLNPFELITSQNNLLTAKTQAMYSQFDYVLKIKLLEFYKGNGLKF